MKILCLNETVGPKFWINGQTPRQRCWLAEQFLIEIVSPPPDCLTNRHPGCEHVGQSPERDVSQPAKK